jgi:hypothetical protein
MARITSPSAKQIIAEASLSLATLDFEEEGDAVRAVNDLLTPIVRSINLQVDAAARPLQFPFDDDALRAASPWKSDAEILEEREDQEGEVFQWILTAAAARLVGRAIGRQRVSPGGQNPVKDRYEELVAAREEHKKTALAEIQRVSSQASAPEPETSAPPRSQPSCRVTVRGGW